MTAINGQGNIMRDVRREATRKEEGMTIRFIFECARP